MIEKKSPFAMPVIDNMYVEIIIQYLRNQVYVERREGEFEGLMGIGERDKNCPIKRKQIRKVPSRNAHPIQAARIVKWKKGTSKGSAIYSNVTSYLAQYLN